ncbi:hypothetical protein EJ06DRAFT_15506 [Trichodelitschia bisporula]|uniref:Cell wall protein n=1 Tax=Trichodelitschia bisporula TaxID=703511 RepID=A0A6G1IA61_9PEZI|nr:hypothetical protein EJ06DRAFT_15506 [Trichodelitschia bisporula]
MRFSHLLLAVCFAALSAAKTHHGNRNGTATAAAGRQGGRASGNGTASASGASTRAQCAEVKRLTTLTELAANTTQLTELQTKQNLTVADIDDIKQAAANAKTRLTALRSNSTLIAACAVVEADNKLQSQCHQIQRLTKLAGLANNAAALQELQTRRNLTATQLDEIKVQASNATTRLRELQANTTLTASCQNQKASNGKKNQTGVGAAGTPPSGNKVTRSIEASAASNNFMPNGFFVLVAGASLALAL